MAAAYALQAQGEALKATLDTAMHAIEVAEGDPEVFTGDEFACHFEAKYKEVQDGTQTQVALRENVRQIGDVTSALGAAVATAMSSYLETDEGNAGEIVEA
jgi:hypothetical protein